MADTKIITISPFGGDIESESIEEGIQKLLQGCLREVQPNFELEIDKYVLSAGAPEFISLYKLSPLSVTFRIKREVTLVENYYSTEISSPKTSSLETVLEIHEPLLSKLLASPESNEFAKFCDVQSRKSFNMQVLEAFGLEIVPISPEKKLISL
jgi:hypothetical protein